MFGPRALCVTIVLTALAGILLGVFPHVDFAVSDFFEDSQPSFGLASAPWAKHLRSLGFVLPVLVALIFLGALVAKAMFPKLKLFADSRAIVAVLLTFAIGPGLLVNVLLKEHWDRQRPVSAIEAVEQGDTGAFQPWWNPYGTCRSNCSFVSGEVSAAAMMIGAGAVLPAALAPAAVGAAIAVTALVGFLRLAFGGHFLSDVVLAVLLTQCIAVGMQRIMYDRRWPPGRPGVIDAALQRAGRPLRSWVSRLPGNVLRRRFRRL